jgi:hypothetical protein
MIMGESLPRGAVALHWVVREGPKAEIVPAAHREFILLAVSLFAREETYGLETLL